MDVPIKAVECGAPQPLSARPASAVRCAASAASSKPPPASVHPYVPRRRIVEAMIQAPLNRPYSRISTRCSRGPASDDHRACGLYHGCDSEQSPNGSIGQSDCQRIRIAAALQRTPARRGVSKEVFDQIFVQVRRLERELILAQGSLRRICENGRIDESAEAGILL